MSIRDLAPWNWGKRAPRAPARWDAFSDPFENLRHEMNRIFDSFFREWRLEPAGFFRERWGDFTPQIEMVEKADEIEVKAELPGLSEKDVEISLSEGTLTLKGEKRREAREERDGMQYCECAYGSFHREIRLPCAVKDDKAEATFKNGVLVIRIPKADDAMSKGRKIEIKQG